MKINRFLLVLLILTSIFYTSCKKYLASESGGLLLAKSIEDYDHLLNNPNLEMGTGEVLDMMTDNADDPDYDLSSPASLRPAYLWADQLDITTPEAPIIWAQCYQNIYLFNTVIYGVDLAETGSVAEKAELKAEARVGRAFEYLYLVNLYGKPYSGASAGRDLAVPFVTSTDIADKTPERGSVEFIYDQIIYDLKLAIKDLPMNNSNKFRGSVSAAYSILARTYLYMNNYSEAAKYANLTLQENTLGLLNLNDKQVEGIEISKSKQEIYTRFNGPFQYPLFSDNKFPGLFERGDLRVDLFYTSLARSKAYIYLSTSPYGNNSGTSVAEMKLIIAEAAARANNLNLSLMQLNELRKFRIETLKFKPFESTSQEEVLQRILLERRLEFAFKGLRWMDMRRLDAENRMPVVSHMDKAGKLVAELKPHSSKYTLKIPAVVLKFNPNMQQN
jgi:hypothetical protein